MSIKNLTPKDANLVQKIAEEFYYFAFVQKVQEVAQNWFGDKARYVIFDQKYVILGDWIVEPEFPELTVTFYDTEDNILTFSDLLETAKKKIEEDLDYGIEKKYDAVADDEFGLFTYRSICELLYGGYDEYPYIAIRQFLIFPSDKVNLNDCKVDLKSTPKLTYSSVFVVAEK